MLVPQLLLVKFLSLNCFKILSETAELNAVPISTLLCVRGNKGKKIETPICRFHGQNLVYFSHLGTGG